MLVRVAGSLSPPWLGLLITITSPGGPKAKSSCLTGLPAPASRTPPWSDVAIDVNGRATAASAKEVGRELIV